jgi:hypothetical protein
MVTIRTTPDIIRLWGCDESLAARGTAVLNE